MVLKPLADATRDGNYVHAVLRGSATNHGGRATTMFSPNSRAQSAVVTSAIEDAGVPVGTISYIEMHGTGTYVGDPVEVRSLTRAFNGLAEKRGVQLGTGMCGLGSVKGHVGHLEPASGMAGLFKVIGAMRDRAIPGMPGFEQPNPGLKLEETPFRVIGANEQWTAPAQDIPLRAGITSIGFGGVNAHVVVEQAPEPQETEVEQSHPVVFPFSAKNPRALRACSTRCRRGPSRPRGGFPRHR